MGDGCVDGVVVEGDAAGVGGGGAGASDPGDETWPGSDDGAAVVVVDTTWFAAARRRLGRDRIAADSGTSMSRHGDSVRGRALEVADSLAKGKQLSSKTTCRDVMTRCVVRSKQR